MIVVSIPLVNPTLCILTCVWGTNISYKTAIPVLLETSRFAYNLGMSFQHIMGKYVSEYGKFSFKNIKRNA